MQMQSEVKARVSYLVQKNYVVLVGQNGGVAGVRNPLKKQFHGALRIFTSEPVVLELLVKCIHRSISVAKGLSSSQICIYKQLNCSLCAK